MMDYNSQLYKSKDGSLKVRFLFLDCGAGEGWRAYVLTRIDYRGRYSGNSTVHTIPEERSWRIKTLKDFTRNHRLLFYDRWRDDIFVYLCWTKKVPTLKQMTTIASVWTDITAYYIKHGGSFPEIQKKLAQQGVI